MVLGIGNRLMTDDGIGVWIVEKLIQNKDAVNKSGAEEVLYIIGETDFDFCLDQIENAGYLIIIDAVKMNKEPGEVTVFPLKEVLAGPLQGHSAHDHHLLSMLSYLRKDLDGILIGIEPCEVAFHIGLSDILSRNFPEILHKVENIIIEI